MNRIFEYRGEKRIIYIETNSSKNKYLREVKLEKKKSSVIASLKDRKVKIIIKIKDSNKDFFLLQLYGLDSKLKHMQNKFTNFNNIFKKIDKMPMRVEELNSKEYKPIKKDNYTLYSDDNPRSTTQGTGYKNEKRALETIKIIKKLKNPKKAFQIINTMYFRARHHPNRTKNMELAMKIFKKWLDNHKLKNK